MVWYACVPGYRPLPLPPLSFKQARASRFVVRSRLVFRHVMRGVERGVSFPICRQRDNLLIDSVSYIRTYFPLLLANISCACGIYYMLIMMDIMPGPYRIRSVRPLPASKQIGEI